MKKIKCIFCSKLEEKSKEHVWPIWLQSKFGDIKKSFYSGTHISMVSGLSVSKREHSGEKFILGNVCIKCNNDWMSELENGFKTIYNKIEKDNDNIFNLTKNERKIFIQWVFKTALVLNAASNYRKIVPGFHFNHFYLYKTLPKDAKIDLALIIENKTLFSLQGPINFKLRANDDENSDLLLNEKSYSIALQINKLGMRVSYYENAKQQNYTINSIHEENEIRLWPYIKKPNFKKGILNLHLFQMGPYLKKP